MVTATPESTREELIEAIANLNLAAKAESRRGFAGVHSDRYNTYHANLDVLITELEMRDWLALA